MKSPQFLILTGDGINCERETSMAFTLAKAKTKIIHINDLLENPKLLKDFDGMALPGGFSFGDDLGSGQVLSLKIKHGLSEEFNRFVDDKKPIIGICNGFQVLMKLGLLPYPKEERTMALAHNESGHFQNDWCELNIQKNTVCKWTLNFKEEHFKLPYRHGEGRIVFAKGREEELYNSLMEKGQIPFKYSENINGSYEKIAGVCDEEGLILGMMPHPEAYLFEATNKEHRNSYTTKGAGQVLFDSIVKYLNNR